MRRRAAGCFCCLSMLRYREMKLRAALPLAMLVVCLAAGPVAAGACSNPTTPGEGDIIYNGAYHTYQFCNGTNWIEFGGGIGQTTSGGTQEQDFLTSTTTLWTVP